MKAFLRGLLIGAALVALEGQTVGNGSYIGVSHVEAITVTNASLSCTLNALCSVGAVTFKSPFPDTNYRCALTPLAATAAVSFIPTASAKTTTGLNVNALAALALVTQSVSV